MRLLLAVLCLLLAGCDRREPSAPLPVRAVSDDLQLSGRVVDAAKIIPDAEETTLVAMLAALERDTTDQMVVATVPTLKGTPIANFTTDLGNRWGLGQAKLDNGVLLVVAPTERQARIGVGHGLEGLLTDERAAGIVNMMLPEFRAGRPSQAISLGVQRTEEILRSDLKRPRPRPLAKAA